MKRLLALIIFLVFAIPALATYEEAYQAYLVQFDLYRKSNSDFQVAKNEYLKFKTLTSQATALEKTKAMMTLRDQLLRSYLLVLYEKVGNANSGLTPITREQYQKMLGNEIAFLETHAQTIASVGSLEDAQQISGELESRYTVQQTAIRQILTGLSLGQLAIVAKYYDALVIDAKALLTQSGSMLSIQKQETVNRWILQIVNKRSFYQQKVDAITLQNATLDVNDPEDLDTQYNTMVRGLGEARQYLVEGISNLTELRDALKYVN